MTVGELDAGGQEANNQKRPLRSTGLQGNGLNHLVVSSLITICRSLGVEFMAGWWSMGYKVFWSAVHTHGHWDHCSEAALLLQFHALSHPSDIEWDVPCCASILSVLRLTFLTCCWRPLVNVGCHNISPRVTCCKGLSSDHISGRWRIWGATCRRGFPPPNDELRQLKFSEMLTVTALFFCFSI